ncbi:NAD-dependent epimerase/dehydratase family protein [Bacillus gaemokensis]|uniref:UDP-2-acetamido-2,6-dideoxy-hexulose 4-reductase n=1 Tax=Bacillus gaemokensis TaxID=574375 RepID=A0A073K6R6_9BACI|nr:NAD-dependent epimerase/dehydratase family protein [Bacillus gaemokensis]KEK22944.1 UDP-2-acetamido-2,6-dideoxy-hexulose 4-reductase [Bacillus gaemokensis]KYG37500.1 UDP-2-acetamido-2,6-dideoxy-hexulose 4-reductase [Bacillus gaemokensis]
MKKNARLLITGANGFTGRHACQYFLNYGLSVIPVFQTKHRALEIANSEVCDLRNKTQVMSLIEKVKPDYVLHLAGGNSVLDSWKTPLKYIEVNAMGTLYLLEAIRNEVPSCKTLVVGSALQHDFANGTAPSHPYSFSKTMQVAIALAWEELVGANVVIARPSNIVGPGFSNGICSILGKRMIDIEEGNSQPVIELSNLQTKRDYVDVRDVVAAYHLLLWKGESGTNYDIGSGVARSLLEVVTQYKELTQLDFQIRETEKSESKELVSLNINEIRKLGWIPRISFADSLKDVLAYMKNK